MGDIQVMVSALLALTALFKAHPYACTAVLVAYGCAQLWKSQPRAWREDVVKKYPRLTIPVDLVNYIFPDGVAIARLLKFRGVRGIGERPLRGWPLQEHETEQQPVQGTPMNDQLAEPDDAEGSGAPDDRATRGFVDLKVLRAVAIGIVAALCVVAPIMALPGCPMPPIDHCTVGAARCSPNGVPQHCDTEGRWTPVDDQCAAYGNECVVTRAYSERNIAVCLRPDVAAEVRDGGR